MSESMTKRTGAIAKVKHWLTGQLASEVPLDIALCEYGCRKPQCLQEDWEHCERRLAFIKSMQVTPEEAKAKSRNPAKAGKRKAARRSQAGQAQ